MGMGSDPCGGSLCGLDAQVSTTVRQLTAPPALAFDGLLKNFRLDSSGRYKSVHPVDAKVFLLVRTTAASIRSAVTVGQTVNRIGYIDQRTIQAQVEDRVRTVLQPVIDAGEIRLDGVDVDTAVRGRVMFAVNYVNLITGRSDTVTSS